MVFVACASMFVCCSAIAGARRPSVAARFRFFPTWWHSSGIQSLTGHLGRTCGPNGRSQPRVEPPTFEAERTLIAGPIIEQDMQQAPTLARELLDRIGLSVPAWRRPPVAEAQHLNQPPSRWTAWPRSLVALLVTSSILTVRLSKGDIGSITVNALQAGMAVRDMVQVATKSR